MKWLMKTNLLLLLSLTLSITNGQLTLDDATVGVFNKNPATNAPTFLPSDISGLARWGRPDLLGSNNLDVVTTYPDSSGNGRTFNGTSTNKPTYATAGINGYPAIRYTASLSSWMECDSSAQTLFGGTNTPFSYFVVVKHATIAAASQCMFMVANVSPVTNWSPTIDQFYTIANGGSYLYARRDDINSQVQLYGCGLVPDTTARVLGRIFDGTNDMLWVDGVMVSSHVPACTGALTVNSWTYGTHRRVDVGNNDIPFNGWMGDDLVYSRALSNSEVTNVCNYLRTAYATPSAPPYDLQQANPANLLVWNRDDTWTNSIDDSLITAWPNRTVYNVSPLVADFTNPRYRTSVQNGRAMVKFHGTNYMKLDGLSSYFTGSDKPFTLAMVIKPEVLTNTHAYWSIGRSTDANPLLYAYVTPTTTNYNVFKRDDAASSLLKSGGVADTNAHSVVIRSDGNLVYMMVDGTNVVDGQSLNVGTTTLDRYTIAANRRNSIAAYFNGWIGEHGVWDLDVGAVSQTNISAYLKTRWGTP